jgi:hypothetical protein
LGISKAQETMQSRQPRHLSSRQITGPSFVFVIARVRHADAQAGALQCMHWRLTKISSPSAVSNRLTTDHCVSEVSLHCLKTL